MPATIRRFSLSDEGFARTSVREKHAEPCNAVQDVTACTMQRQAKRLRAETEATAYSTIAPGFGKGRISAGTGSKLAVGKPACKRPFLSCTGRGAVFLFGQAPKRKIGGRRAPPLPGAEKRGLSAPQPRHWRSVAKQDREWHLRQGGCNTQGTVCKPAGEERIATSLRSLQ